jgi:hypothetical protein
LKYRIRDLAPIAEGMSAFVLWRSLPRQPQKAQLIVLRSGAGYFWCGGFSGMPSPGEAFVTVRILARRADAASIRQAMWGEAISGLGLRSRDIRVWAELVRRHLPQDLMRQSARVFGVTRQTMSLHLQGANV